MTIQGLVGKSAPSRRRGLALPLIHTATGVGAEATVSIDGDLANGAGATTAVGLRRPDEPTDDAQVEAFASLVLRSPSESGRPSAHVCGDVNGDGFCDVIVGAGLANPGGRPEAGTASVLRGSSSGLLATSALVLAGDETGARFGWSVTSAGDVNGDGFADVLVGAPRANPGGRTLAGTGTLFVGSPSGLLPTPEQVLEGDEAADRFGSAVASAGDVNGDGIADVIVGAPLASPGGRTRAGEANLFLGAPSGLVSTPAEVLEGEGAEDRFGWSVPGPL